MKIDLEVLASTCIKRKKPWPMIIWIGEEQESILLLDAPGKRISVLYVPSGKTKKLPKLSPFVEQIICFSSTKNGHFLLGILQTGDLCVWHKDKDNLKFVSGLEKLTNNFHTEHICISASGKCTYILIVVGHREFYLWMMEKGETIFRGGDIKLKGSWHRIVVPEGMELSSTDSMECTISAVFYDNHVLGHCCQCSMVYNRESMMNVATLVLKFPDPIDSFGSNVPLFSAEWSLLQYPFQQMHPAFEPISTKGAYVSSYSGSGQVLAVAANQRAPSRSTMLFVSPLTDTVLVGGMKNCGIGDPSKTGRHYWVSDLCWTADNLFLTCIMKNGSVCLIPRLGEPIPLQTNGCSVTMGPSYFLALHPAVFVSENQESLEPSAAEQDPLQQHFSVATHPSLPIMLFSDGFLVTVAQLPGEMTSASLMRELVLESAKYMKKLYQQENLDMTVADAYRLSKGHNISRQQHSARNRQNKPYQFELAELSLNGTIESEKSFIETINNDGFNKFGVVGNMDSGKILFGEPEMICIDPNATFSGLEASDALLRYLEESMTALTLVWKLASSHCDMWTSDVDNITKQAVHNLSKVFNVVLNCPAVDAIIPVLTPRQSSAIQNPRVYNIIVAYRNILQLLRFDTFNQHLIPAALRLVHKTITLMLCSEELERTDPKIKTLFGCYSLLKHAENSLNRIYVWVPSESQASTPTCDGSPRRYEPAIMVKIEKQSAESGTDVHGIPLNNKGYLPGNRLAATWKLLYKHALDYCQSNMSNSGNTQNLLQVKKLMYNIQQVLQENEAPITPKNASERLSAVWLRHAFPFGLLTDSDSFLYSDEDTESKVGLNSSSFSPCMSILKMVEEPFFIEKNSHNMNSTQKSAINSSVNVRSLSISPESSSGCNPGEVRSSYSSKENTDSNQGDISPSSAGQSTSMFRITGLSTISNHGHILTNEQHSPSRYDSNFKIFDKIKSALSVSKSPSLSPKTSSGSTVQVGSFSSSSKDKSSSGSSFLNGIKSSLKIGTYSSSSKNSSHPSSPKESSSNLTTSDKSSSIPIITIDIIDNKNGTCQDLIAEHNGTVVYGKDEFEPVDLKSEGFSMHESRDLEMSQKSSSHNEILEWTKKFVIEVAKSDKLSIAGKHSSAVQVWKEQLKVLATKKKDSPKTAKMLHSILYTYLLEDDLAEAVDFIDNLILQASVDIAMSSQELPAYEDGSRPPMMTLVTHRSQDSEEEELVPCIKNKSIRKTVESMGRFMAAYFSNQTMFIYPPHSAQMLPTVHIGSIPTKSRIIPKYHEDITNVITQKGLSGVWTTERTVEYLLLSGLICETTWFAHKMGDWKTAFLLAVAHTSHTEIAPQLYSKPKEPLQLLDSLTPNAILQEKMEILIKSNKADRTPAGANKHCSRYFIPINQETNIPQLTKTLQDIMTAGIISDVEIAPWLLSHLIAKLKSVTSNLTSLVPKDFYLPAPPLYCPQPGEEEVDMDQPDVQYEKELRMELSSIIQLYLVALNSCHLSLPAARWYIQELFPMQDRASQFKATTEGPCLELPEILQQFKILKSDIVEFKDHVNVRLVMSSFRDFCSIVWFLHVRDELSLNLRKRGKQLNNDKNNGNESLGSTLGQKYVQECFKILKWAVHMLAFSQYIADDGWIQKVILSLILELPATEDTADILAEHFYAAETFDSEVQEKLDRLLSSWQSVEILPEDDGKSAKPEENEDPRKSLENDDDDSVRKSVTFYQASPRAKTLSVYFHKQCEVVQKVLKKKMKCFGEYDEFVFHQASENDNGTIPLRMGSDSIICIGSRPFETKQSFLEFLDRFYAICFTKVIQKESGKTPMYALLMPFTKMIRNEEFQKFFSQNEDIVQKCPSSVVLASPRAKFMRSQSESHVSEVYESKLSPVAGQKTSLLSTTTSGDARKVPGHAGMLRYRSEGSLLYKGSSMHIGTPNSPSRAKVNMTGMASRFFQSEDVLYRDVGQARDTHWILDVNFGQRYLVLQHLLDYLHNWAGKQHPLGLHGKNNKDLGLKPTMRIEVPSQLVVLGLWLLEHKYSGGKTRNHSQAQNEEIKETVSNLNVKVMTQEKVKQRALHTVEELTEHDSFTQVSNIPRSKSHSPTGQMSLSHSPKAEVLRSQKAGVEVSKDRTLELVKSITSTQEETEQMKTAYKKVLDGGDDSSSLEVSSLEPDDYEDDLKQTLSALGSGRLSRKESPRHKSSARHVESSPDTRNNSVLSHTIHFEGSPERTSTPLNTKKSASRRPKDQQDQPDIFHTSLPPDGGFKNNKAATIGGKPSTYSSRLPVENSVPMMAPGVNVMTTQTNAGNAQSLAGLDLATQLQQIVRGELRRMMEVQHQSMMAMMGALDGQLPPPIVAWQPDIAVSQRQAQQLGQPLSAREAYQNESEEHKETPQDKKPLNGVLRELKNLEMAEGTQKRLRRSQSLHGKENVDSTLKMSHLKSGENIEVYRLSHNGPDPSNISFYPNFLRIPAERDQENVRFPNLFNKAWNSRDDGILKDRIPEMPLLHVDRAIQAHKFPVSNHSSSLPVYVPEPGYFQSGFGQAPGSFPNLIAHFQSQAARQSDSPDSGIGIPLLVLPNEDKGVKHQLKFGELLPPDMVDSVEERQKKAMLHEKYLREYHTLQSEKAKADFTQRFGDDLLHLEATSQLVDTHDSPTPRKTPRKMHSPHSPRKTPRSLYEQSSSKMSQKRQTISESVKVDSDVDEQVKSSEKHSIKHSEEEESEDEDATEAEPMIEEEEIHNGYAIRPGEFEAYLSLENQLAQTKDTHARIQLKTALRLQRQRMMENWKRPKVEFATNTEELLEAGTDPDDLIAMEREHVYTSEKATCITKDTGVDPIQEAVIEYNKTRRAHVLPPDIYMGLRFAEAGQQPSSDVTGHPQESRGRSYLNVVDVNASMVLNDLREKPEHDEPLLDVTLSAAQQQLRNRIAMEDDTRMTLERPKVPTPSHADELTVKLFESKFQGEDRMSLAVMPRDSMPASKYAIMQRLRDMNVQLAAIDQMSNNMEREFKSTRLAIHTLEEMTDAMEAPTRDQQDRYEDQQMSERTTTGSGTLSPQPSVKSPTLSTRASARVSASSKKVTVEDKKQLSQELAKLSGLSGVSDIIGDMVAKGEIDLDDVGLSRREAEKLFQRGVIRKEEVDEARISLEEIKKMTGKASRDRAEDREALRHWMAMKHRKQMEEYHRHLEDLREKESKPFRPAASDRDDQSLTIKERKALAEARDESRKASKREFMTKRLDEAQHLLGNILTDKPELPKELPARVTPKHKPTKDKSPVSLRGHAAVKAKMLKVDNSPDRKLHGILKTTDQTQKYLPYDVKEEIDNYYHNLDLSDESMNEPDLMPVVPRQISVQPAKEPSDQPTSIEVSPIKAPWQKPAGTVPRLRLDLDDVEEEPQKLQNTGETTGELSDYYKAVEAMDVSSSQEQSRDFGQQPQRELDVTKDVPVAKTFKFKPYTKIVKVQRPGITRKQPNIAMDYVGGVQTTSQSETSRTSVRSDMTQRQKEMIYGSKRIPVKKQPETTPRRVKTYTERLQDMKSKETYTTPVAPRSHLGSSVASMSSRRVSRPVRPRHKPVTYTQQLQKLNEGYHHQKVNNKTQIITKPVLKSHKPFHRPKTYTQQLQQLQPHKTFKGPSGKRGGLKSLASRQRPYQDPYAAVAVADFDQFETASVVSAWSMGDDVRHILYNDVESSLAMGKSSYAPSEQISDYYDAVMGEDDYTASVDIDDLVRIADSGSMSSGSMMSFIDWDQVDDLIADVR